MSDEQRKEGSEDEFEDEDDYDWGTRGVEDGRLWSVPEEGFRTQPPNLRLDL
jgi:hypothetical protein